MRITDSYESNGATFYTVEIDEDVFVDVKCTGNLCYVMQCENGFETYDSDGHAFDCYFDENEVIKFVKKHQAME